METRDMEAKLGYQAVRYLLRSKRVARIETSTHLRAGGQSGVDLRRKLDEVALRNLQRHKNPFALQIKILTSLYGRMQGQQQQQQQPRQPPQATLEFSRLRDKVRELEAERATLSVRLQRTNTQLEQLGRV